ncbi:hypothetical protein FQA39_LY13050 [Lamprigera yunnana]|nr:hypothetical protein FQA39_LY13050 [Lamprigera yunnana]
MVPLGKSVCPHDINTCSSEATTALHYSFSEDESIEASTTTMIDNIGNQLGESDSDGVCSDKKQENDMILLLPKEIVKSFLQIKLVEH